MFNATLNFDEEMKNLMLASLHPFIASLLHRFIASTLLVPSSPCWHGKDYLAVNPHCLTSA
jgi:hypothetical protein